MRKWAGLCVFAAGLTASAGAWADQADFCMEMTSVLSKTQANLATAQCEVVQNLDPNQEDFKALWKCRFNRSETLSTLVADADAIGYDYQVNAAYSVYKIGAKTKLGAFLLGNLGLSGAQDDASLRVTYGDSPYTHDKDLIFSSPAEAYELKIGGLRYGGCDKPAPGTGL